MMNTDTNLSGNQKKILDTIRHFVQEKGYAPSVRDICAATGIRSTSTVHLHLKNLEKLGFIRKDQTKSRAIELLDEEKIDFPSDADTRTAFVPVVGRVAAGMPILAQQNIVGSFPIPEEHLPKNDVFILRVKGDSMINAGIFDGDYILVERVQTAENGEIVVALIDDGATVKTFYKETDHIRLQPENDTMEPILVKDVEISGRLIGVFRFLR